MMTRKALTTTGRLRRILVTCPACGAEATALQLLRDWNGQTYRFMCCGARNHLNHLEGGARTRLTSHEPGQA